MTCTYATSYDTGTSACASRTSPKRDVERRRPVEGRDCGSGTCTYITSRKEELRCLSHVVGSFFIHSVAISPVPRCEETVLYSKQGAEGSHNWGSTRIGHVQWSQCAFSFGCVAHREECLYELAYGLLAVALRRWKDHVDWKPFESNRQGRACERDGREPGGRESTGPNSARNRSLATTACMQERAATKECAFSFGCVAHREECLYELAYGLLAR
eukprot:CAMPEP_0198134378 /NCGR_PEP_ID=MMETSP1442-20131203/60047_1 /TAXON_ID= /ORGANISM="Craspedostauros australis, Strain CCMP3328" /LENGTH=214 /DNA_ID=CAMNT_0043795521 /DNA_START=351 /DNA_END=995 /DNA_ORIENTATION=+